MFVETYVVEVIVKPAHRDLPAELRAAGRPEAVAVLGLQGVELGVGHLRRVDALQRPPLVRVQGVAVPHVDLAAEGAPLRGVDADAVRPGVPDLAYTAYYKHYSSIFIRLMMLH